ncbi:DUF4304 domain-containing protein [Duganella sp. CY15W]|uniref:DUF4304 domain-containing protein n=1 Tax=Duganella sp. CY15W TaxID=2692172 RepID=UPI00136EB0B2|nr:DUF4304 domain-containing protein [Duganella sp. CY15W]MYM27408.1 DUF4304 domain-containing protein [Duganella sp. CY15W]
MSEIAKAIDELVRIGIMPILKDAGFKKKARNFHLVQTESIAVINVQASQWNSGKEGQFTFNVGRYYPALDARVRGGKLSFLPKEYECTIRRRVGSLMPEGIDIWWTVNLEQDNTQIVEQTRNVVQEFAIPWLARIESIAGLKDLLEHEASIDAAEILIFLGNTTGAKQCLQRLMSIRPTDWRRIELWAHQHGIDLG